MLVGRPVLFLLLRVDMNANNEDVFLTKISEK